MKEVDDYPTVPVTLKKRPLRSKIKKTIEVKKKKTIEVTKKRPLRSQRKDHWGHKAKTIEVTKKRPLRSKRKSSDHVGQQRKHVAFATEKL